MRYGSLEEIRVFGATHSGPGALKAILLGLLVGSLLVPGGVRAGSVAGPDLSRVRVLAIAPFADEAPLSLRLAQWGTARMHELAARGPFEVVSLPRVAEAMQQLGITPGDLMSPSRTVTLGRQLGADAVLTGRVVMVQQDREREDAGVPPAGALNSRVDVDVRVLEVATRRILFQEHAICHLPGTALAAVECAVREIALRLGMGRV
jgi:hypothetical protein